MFCHGCGKEIVDDAVVCVGCGRAVVPLSVAAFGAFDPYLSPEAADFASKKLPAGLCAIFLGPFGVHKFILGQTTPGLIMLLGTVLTCGAGWIITHPIGIIEGIVYLTKSDAEFYRLYGVERKGWF